MGSFSLAHWLILGLIGFVLFSVFSGKGGKVKYCKTCGHTGKTESHTPGNLAIEIILWLCFIIPGLIYSIWRLSSKTAKCEKCGGKELVPTDSPVAIAANNSVKN